MRFEQCGPVGSSTPTAFARTEAKTCGVSTAGDIISKASKALFRACEYAFAGSEVSSYPRQSNSSFLSIAQLSEQQSCYQDSQQIHPLGQGEIAQKQQLLQGIQLLSRNHSVDRQNSTRIHRDLE